jgi:hypothetical protein
MNGKNEMTVSVPAAAAARSTVRRDSRRMSKAR